MASTNRLLAAALGVATALGSGNAFAAEGRVCLPASAAQVAIAAESGAVTFLRRSDKTGTEVVWRNTMRGVDSERVNKLEGELDEDWGISISRDGHTVYYLKPVGLGTSRIAVVGIWRLRSSSLQELASLPLEGDCGAVTPFGRAIVANPDGARIAFRAYRSMEGGHERPGVCVWNSQTGTIRWMAIEKAMRGASHSTLVGWDQTGEALVVESGNSDDWLSHLWRVTEEDEAEMGVLQGRVLGVLQDGAHVIAARDGKRSVYLLETKVGGGVERAPRLEARLRQVDPELQAEKVIQVGQRLWLLSERRSDVATAAAKEAVVAPPKRKAARQRPETCAEEIAMPD